MRVLSLEERSFPSSSIISPANKLQQSKLEHEKVLHCELDIEEDICLFNNLISNVVCGNKFQSLVSLRFLKNSYVFKKGGILSNMKLFG